MPRMPVRLILGSLLLVAGVAAAQESGYAVYLADDVEPRMLAGEAAQKAISLVATRAIADLPAQGEPGKRAAAPVVPEVLEVHCIRGRDFGALVPYSGTQELPWDPVWVVRVKGPMTKRTPDGRGQIHADTGYVLIDDATGEVVGRGAPWPDDPQPQVPKPSP